MYVFMREYNRIGGLTVMRFVKYNDIRMGMRLAKPIYNTEGVLLYGRGTVINDMVMHHINNMTAYGFYILDATEPLPDITEEEMEFERFQIVACYTIRSELMNIFDGQETPALENLIHEIVDTYGSLSSKISFIQSIRNPDDFVYKHLLNVAMLSAMISHKLGVDKKEQYYIVRSAMYHDIGKIIGPKELINKPDKLTREELNLVRRAELEGFDMVKNCFKLPSGVKRYVTQLRNELTNKMPAFPSQPQTLLLGTKIIQIADMYDILTAMRVYKEPTSEFAAIKHLTDHDSEFDSRIVSALISSINILPPGCCVELTNGEKGLVLSESEYYALRPTVLAFKTNTIYDLSNKKTYEQVKIKDIVKTMDNRFQMTKPSEVGKLAEQAKQAT